MTKPLLIVPTISKENRVKFILPEKEIFLDESVTPTAWAILDLCNGVNSVDVIVEQLDYLDETFIVGFLNDLNSIGVIIDSRKAYQHFHAISSNPMRFTTDLTSDEITAHAGSSRLSVKDGVVFGFNANPESVLLKLQQQRRSVRAFANELLSIDEIGSVLDIGYSLARHAVPSAGGLYPMKIFAVVLETQKDFPAGYYEYDNEKGCLVLFRETPDPQRIYYAFNDTELPFGAPVVIVIAADANRQPYKYSNRGYRFMAIEAGQIAQNISLAAVEIGLATCELGGILDDAITDELGLEGCLPFLAISIGKEGHSRGVSYAQTADYFEKMFVGEGKPVQSSWSIDDTLVENFNKPYFQFMALTSNGQITSGISTSWADAKVKAIAEAYERQQSAVVHYDVRSSARELKADWLDPRIVAPLTDEQYETLPLLQKFDENLQVEWIRGFDSTSKTVFVPIDLVFYPIGDIGRKPVVNTCSSGFATYTDYDEAVNRGLLELVERDGLMRHWYERKSPQKLGFEVLPVHLRNRIRYWQERGREVFVLDLSQWGVIVTQVVIISGEYPCFVSGASSSLGDFGEAAIKAFYEAESRLIYGLNEGGGRTVSPEEVQCVLDHELLYAQSKKYHKYVEFLFDGLVSHDAPAASTTFSTIRKDLEAVAVDISEENVLLKVVKVLSPKVIPINFGYGTGHYAHYSLCGVGDISKTIPHYFA